jgi:DNA-binding PadR family transcriptional regulator
MRQVAQQTDGRVRLGPGTLYGSIKTLLEARLIQELDERPDATLGAERRRYYHLTSSGLKLVRSEAQNLAALLRVARARRILRGAHV